MREKRAAGAAGSRTAILKAAEARFAREGIDGASMREIAEDVGITKAALYYHFKSKDELYFGVFEHLIAERKARMDEIWEKEDCASLPPEKRLEVLAGFLMETFATNPHIPLLIERSLLDPDRQRQKRCVETAYAGIFGKFHEIALELKVPCNTHQWTAAVIGLCFMPYQGRSAASWLPGWSREAGSPEAIRRAVLAVLFPEKSLRIGTSER